MDQNQSPSLESISTRLIKAGWTLVNKCNCGGTPREDYRNSLYGGYELRVRPQRQTFVILQKNMVIAGAFWGYQLEEKMKKFIDGLQ